MSEVQALVGFFEVVIRAQLVDAASSFVYETLLMTLAENAALADIRGYGAANRIQLTLHARQRMEQRRTRFQELRSILINAPACSALPSERWRVHGVDADGDVLEVILAIHDGLVIITLFG